MCVHGIEETRTWGNKNLGKQATLHATPVIKETHRAKVCCG